MSDHQGLLPCWRDMLENVWAGYIDDIYMDI